MKLKLGIDLGTYNSSAAVQCSTPAAPRGMPRDLIRPSRTGKADLIGRSSDFELAYLGACRFEGCASRLTDRRLATHLFPACQALWPLLEPLVMKREIFRYQRFPRHIEPSRRLPDGSGVCTHKRSRILQSTGSVTAGCPRNGGGM